MKDFLKKISRPAFILILCVYVLSVPYDGKPLYTHARGVLVENRVVSLIIEHSSALYNQVKERVRLAVLESASPKEKSTN